MARLELSQINAPHTNTVMASAQSKALMLGCLSLRFALPAKSISAATMANAK
jgi:hypothetical protein